MGFFSRFKRSNVDEVKLNDLVLSMKTWFSGVGDDFKIDEKKLNILAKYLILYNYNYNYSSFEWNRCLSILNDFIGNFKKSVFNKNLIPVEMIFGLCLKQFTYNKNKSYFDILELYGLDSKVLNFMFAGSNLMFFKQDFRYDTPIRDRNYNFSFDETKLIFKKYQIFKKLMLVGNSIGDIGRYQLNLFNSQISHDHSFTLDNYTFDFFFCKVYNETILRGANLYPESNAMLGVYYKKKLVYYLGFEVLGSNKIFIRQIQGVPKSHFNPDVDFVKILIISIEELAKLIGINEVLIFGSNCFYRRPFCKTMDKFEKLEVDKKYDVWANDLNYVKGKDNLWRKNI